jgi:hypothetical protein
MTNVPELKQGSTSEKNAGITVQGLVEQLEKEQQVMKDALLELEQRIGSVLSVQYSGQINEKKEPEKAIVPLVDQLKSILEKTKSNTSLIISIRERCHL